MFYVWQHEHGRKFITRGPAAGLLEWPQHSWTWIARSRSSKAAIAIAESHGFHARVIRGHSGMAEDVIFDNGKAPGIPKGWYPADAETAMDVRGAA